MAWQIAPSLAVLRDEIDQLYPNRSRVTDGVISGYPGSQSSHNENSLGYVCALDVTVGNYPNGITPAQAAVITEKIRVALRDQPRGITAYIIYNRRIADGGNGPEWRTYTGADPHTNHFHVSVDHDIYSGQAPSGLADYMTRLSWNLAKITGQSSDTTPITEEGFLMALPDADQIEVVKNVRKLVYGQQSQDKVVAALTTQVGQLSTQLEEVVGNARKTVYGIGDIKAGLAALPAADIAAVIPGNLAQQVVDALAERLGK